MSGNLARRVVVAAVAIPLALGVVYLGGWTLAAVLAVLGALGAGEIFALAESGGVRPLKWLGMAGAALGPLALHVVVSGGPAAPARDLVLGSAVWLVLLLGITLARRGIEARPLETAAITAYGAAYAGWLPAFVLVLRHLGGQPISPWGGTALAFLPLVTTWVCDTMAMAGGAVFGGPKLAPRLSPLKTWSGAVAGAVGAVVAAPCWGLLLDRLGVAVSWWELLACGVFVGTAGQVGDLAESLLKRQAGVKDSGTFFPGHGGVLDRLDSLYWTLPGTAVILALGGTL